jgi:cytochrome c-type biogenesis protein CcmF
VVWDRVRTPLLVGLAAGAATVLFWTRNGWIVLAVVSATFVAALPVRQLYAAARTAAAKKGTGMGTETVRTLRSDPPYWGGQVAHIGVVVLALGIAISSNQAVEGSFDLSPGDTVRFAGHELTYTAPFTREEPNRTLIGATVEVRRGGDLLTTLEPRLNRYPRSNQPVASPAVDTGLRGDLYLSLASLDGGELELDVYWFPFIWLVWVGGFLAALGGVYAWLVRRPARKRSEETAGV